MINSFRLRLALLWASLTGLALAAFALGSWWVIRDARIQRVDTDVRSSAEREIGRTRETTDWSRIEAALVSPATGCPCKNAPRLRSYL